MRHRRALFLVLFGALFGALAGLAPGLASAQQGSSRPDPRLPPLPAAQPPAPPLLAPSPPPAAPEPPGAAPRPLALPRSMAPLPGGGWRLTLEPAASGPDAAERAALTEIGCRLAAESMGRVGLVSQVSRSGEVSATRRLSLDRAVAARSALLAGGLPETRVDVFPMGRLPAGLDAIDILPPGAARTPP